MNAIFTIIRPKQYIKNIFILLPLFFAGQITNMELLVNALVAFVAFSLSASAVYILNDYKDIKEDRKHPKKKFRPLASGSISKNIALSLMIILLIIGFTLMATISTKALVILSIYVILNIGYSLKLKRIALLDVTLIAIGFASALFIYITVNMSMVLGLLPIVGSTLANHALWRLRPAFHYDRF